MVDSRFMGEYWFLFVSAVLLTLSNITKVDIGLEFTHTYVCVCFTMETHQRLGVWASKVAP